MKKSPRSVLIVALLFAVTCLGSLATAATQEKRKPNIILILADDMGADSVAALNEKCGIPTPEIDSLIQQGMNFTDAHSGSAVCSPTRYGILTGRYSWRTERKAGALGPASPAWIEEGRLTLPEILKQEGYETACFGKWHLGWNWARKGGGDEPVKKVEEIDFSKKAGGGPTAHGFDYYYGVDQPNRPPFAWIENDRTVGIPVAEGVQFAKEHYIGRRKMVGVPGWDLEAVLPTLTERCVDYIKKHAAEEKPYFLYFAMPSPHTPISPSKAFQGKSGISRYADLVIETDWSVGQLVKAVEESGAADNTILIFTADNGTAGVANFEELESLGVDLQHNFRGKKMDAWEGGHRVPFVVSWPGHIKPGSESQEVVTLTDLMATVADVTGATIPDTAAEDSVSLLPALKGNKIDESRREAVICHSGRGIFAVRKGNWKLQFSAGSGGATKPRERDLVKEVVNGEVPAWQLYDLSTDPGEKKNVIETHPEIVKELTAILRQIVENGRSTPGAPQVNFNGETGWKGLPWFDAQAKSKTKTKGSDGGES